ncbi:Hypothetical predicted protein [Podarcis lilfordi]|uniref:Uncharacterized protein n=1 Tax=Podarcis lilfordi TaxID=74358 RepID=A0AA35KWR0_9SAUR|nr:Hypothetical predicted protein [Podarcis lilfordi]
MKSILKGNGHKTLLVRTASPSSFSYKPLASASRLDRRKRTAEGTARLLSRPPPRPAAASLPLLPEQNPTRHPSLLSSHQQRWKPGESYHLPSFRLPLFKTGAGMANRRTAATAKRSFFGED